MAELSDEIIPFMAAKEPVRPTAAQTMLLTNRWADWYLEEKKVAFKLYPARRLLISSNFFLPLHLRVQMPEQLFLSTPYRQALSARLWLRLGV